MTYPPLEHCRAKNIALLARVAELEAELSAWEIGEEYQECFDAYESASSGESAALERVAELEASWTKLRQFAKKGEEYAHTGGVGYYGGLEDAYRMVQKHMGKLEEPSTVKPGR